MIQKLIIEGAIKLLAKKFKLDKVLAYVEEDNEHDKKIKELEKRVRVLEKETIKVNFNPK